MLWLSSVGEAFGIVSASDVWELSDKSGSVSTLLTESAALLRELPLSVWTLKTAGYCLGFSLTFGQLMLVTYYRMFRKSRCICRQHSFVCSAYVNL